MTSQFEFKIEESKLNKLSNIVKDYCLTNGLVFIKSEDKDESREIEHDLATPLPVTLFPTKFPAKEFNYSQDIQNSFNQLILNISNDYDFLKQALKNVILVDDFTRRLWNIYETVRAEGIAQPLTLAILRNDFMLDRNKQDSNVYPTMLSHIEINTISCSFGSATSKVNDLHKHVLLNCTDNQEFVNKHTINQNMNVLAKSIVNAWKLYENQNAKVVFLVMDSEKNIGDQRLLEYECLRQNSFIKILRYSLTDFANRAKLDHQKRLFIDDQEVALVYFRSGYDPKHYANEEEWNARLMIERSMAIKCPNIQVHLVGAKIVQQALSEPGSVEKYITDIEMARKIRSTFVDLYSINKENINEIIDLIDNKSAEFVLKPQREGGGNNFYQSEIRNFVDSLQDKSDLMGYILMKLVDPVRNENFIIKSNQKVKKQTLVSEIGIFGYFIAKGENLLENETGGYLLRTKTFGVNEGGVATGYSALDSIYLV